MDASKIKDIGIRQNLLRAANKNTIPPSHIIQEQRRLSRTKFARQSHQIMSPRHRELCPLCHCPSFIFKQSSKFTKEATFTCSNCSNRAIQSKISQIKALKHDIKQTSKQIEPILIQKLNAPNSSYCDKSLKSKQYQRSISNLRILIRQKQTENKQGTLPCNMHLHFICFVL